MTHIAEHTMARFNTRRIINKSKQSFFGRIQMQPFCNKHCGFTLRKFMLRDCGSNGRNTAFHLEILLYKNEY